MMPHFSPIWHHPLLRSGWLLLLVRRSLALRVIGLSFVASLLALLQPWLSKVLVDDGALTGDLKVLATAAGLMLLAPLLGLAVESITRFDYLELSSSVLFGLRERVFEHLQTLSPVYYSRIGFGDLISRFDGDLAEVQRFLVDGLLALFNGLFSLLAVVILMGFLSLPMMLMVLLAMLPVPLLHGFHKRAMVEGSAREARRQSTHLSNFFLDSLRAVKLIQSTNGEAARMTALKVRHGDYYQALKTAQQTGFSLAAGQRVASLVGTALVFGGGGYLLSNGQISMGVLIAFVGYSARVTGPVHTLMGVLAGWQRLRVSLERLSEVLDAEPPRQMNQESARLPVVLQGAIAFNDVSFAYEQGKPVLRQASLRIPAGSKVLLIGPSGGGKSTLADLLLGHLQPDHGHICIDEVAIAQVPVAELRRRVAVVDQEPTFFRGTVGENLRFVQPLAKDAELLALLQSVGLEAPEVHLQTPVGGVSAALSHGQRLRLALARVLLQAPSILVLDETTSAVDQDMEGQLLDLVHLRFVDCTCLFITHHVCFDQSWDLVCRLTHGAFELVAEGEASHVG
jgi:ATP-binding cassette, subfamily B, bacterial